MKKVLLLGSTGKMGLALSKSLKSDYELIGKNSQNFNAFEFDKVKFLINDTKPDIIINTIAYQGIDQCEANPNDAFKLNTIFPRILADEANKNDSLLVHFSSDSVFNDEKKQLYVESNTPKPLSIYGITKYGGDCIIMSLTQKYYIIRVSILFGNSIKKNQFVEKMLIKIKQGNKSLSIADDIVLSPTYSDDVAKKLKCLIQQNMPYGLYHVVNQGKASLYDLMCEIVNKLQLDVKINKASYLDFPFTGRKNIYTPVVSEKIEGLRPWKEAVTDYCSQLKFLQ